VLWGASPVATKLAVADLPALAVAVLRTLIGGAGAVLIALLLRLPLPSTSAQRSILALSAFGGFISFPLLMTAGLTATSANHASIILALLPVLTGAYAHALERRWPAPVWWIGCVIALTGEVLLITWREPSTSGPSEGPSLGGDALVVAATLFGAMGYVAGARLSQMGYPSTATTFWGAALASVVLLPTLPWVWAGIGEGGGSVEAWAGVLYLAIAVTIVGYVLWYWALGRGGIARVGLTQFLQPVSGLLLAAVLLGEHLTLPLAVAALLVLAGVFIAARAG
jgi:drug/metabolite transporter (DMT)-like permease